MVGNTTLKHLQTHEPETETGSIAGLAFMYFGQRLFPGAGLKRGLRDRSELKTIPI